MHKPLISMIHHYNIAELVIGLYFCAIIFCALLPSSTVIQGCCFTTMNLLPHHLEAVAAIQNARLQLLHHPQYSWDLAPLNWRNSWKDANLLTTRMLSARHTAGWKIKMDNSFITESELWRNPVHFTCRGICWKMTKYDVRILWLTTSVYKLFERPSYCKNQSKSRNYKLTFHYHNACVWRTDRQT